MSKLPIDKLLRFFVCLVLFVAACDSEKFVQPGETRSRVYAVMGRPSNTDDRTVAMWTLNGRQGKGWRALFHGGDAFVVVFGPDDRCLTSKFALAASNLLREMTDEQVIEGLKARPVT